MDQPNAVTMERGGVDPVALRAKYRKERDKRLRAEETGQYRVTDGRLARYLDDPYVAPGFTRAARDENVDVLVIGGGFGGLLAAARLVEAGVGNVRWRASGDMPGLEQIGGGPA